jgi:hypothetical protein
MKRRELRN